MHCAVHFAHCAQLRPKVESTNCAIAPPHSLQRRSGPENNHLKEGSMVVPMGAIVQVARMITNKRIATVKTQIMYSLHHCYADND